MKEPEADEFVIVVNHSFIIHLTIMIIIIIIVLIRVYSPSSSRLFNGPKINRFGGRFCWYSLRSDGVDWQNFATRASLGLKVRVYDSP